MLHLNHFDAEPDSLSGILTLDRFRPEFFLQMFRLHAVWEARLGAGSTHESDVNQLQSADGGWTLTASQLQRRSEVTGSISSSFQKAETWYVCVVLRKRSLRRGGHFRLNFLFRFLIKHSWHFQTFQSVSLLFLWSHLTAGKSALTQHVSSCSWVWCSCAVEALGRMLKCLVTFKENSVAEKALMWRFRTFFVITSWVCRLIKMKSTGYRSLLQWMMSHRLICVTDSDVWQSIPIKMLQMWKLNWNNYADFTNVRVT